MNNFQRLEEEEMEQLPDLPLGIAHRVDNQLSGFRTIGSVVELYLTKFVEVFVMMTGGDTNRPTDSNRTESSDGPPTDPNRRGPGGPRRL